MARVTLREQVQVARSNSVAMIPVGYEHGWRRWSVVGVGIGVSLLFNLNRRLLDRFCPDLPAVWDKAALPWIAELEAAAPVIRAELDAYLAGIDELPETARFSGIDPDSELAKRSVPVSAGHWRSLVLNFMGRWYKTADHFPETVRLTKGRRGVQTVGFSSLDPGSHIVAHRDPNPGALRYQLPLAVPGEPGQCRIRVLDEVIEWREGESVLFDLNRQHEVWNDTDGYRILMMLEIVMPLPFPLSVFNRFVQWSYRYFPSFRGAHERTRSLYETAQLA